MIEPLKEAKKLLDDLEKLNVDDKEKILAFAEVAEKESGMTMGEALLDAKKRSAAGVPQRNRKKVSAS